MNPLSKNNLEEMLNQMGSDSAPECEEHRYTLRRKLLNSRYFDEHRNAMRRRAFMFVPVVASGFAVMILTVATHTTPSINLDFSTEQTETVSAPDPDFLTDGLIATFVDGRPMIPITYQANTVLFTTADTTMNIQ